MNREDRTGLVLAVVVLAALLVAILAIAHRGGKKPPEIPQPAPELEPDTRLERLVPSPIVLLHGMGGSGEAWNTLTESFRNSGLRSGGTVRIGADGEVEFTSADVLPENADFFRFEISNPYQSLRVWTSEVEKLLAAVHLKTRQSRLVLVGHSAGGLTGRRYLVEQAGKHHLAKLVTLASPHHGSGLALIPLFLKKVRDSTAEMSGEMRLLAGGVNRTMAEIEQAFEIPLDAPILPDLLPEKLNPDLTALNAMDHPLDVEYECLRALGGVASESWDQMRQIAGGDLPLSWNDLKTHARNLMALLQGDTSYQGDGAVTVASQDLRRIRFFQLHPDVIQECRGVEAGHSEIRAQVQDILFAITSPVRFLRARRTGDVAQTMLTVDFHDYFAGLAQVEAWEIQGSGLPVSRPAVFLRNGETFGRVEIGPFDARGVQAVDAVVLSSDGRRYGRRIPLAAAAADAANPEREAPERFRLAVLGVEGLPLTPKPWLPFISWDDDGSRADLQIRLLIGGEEVLKSRIHEDVGAAVELQEVADLDADLDLDEEWIVLELWDIDDEGDDPDPIARRVLSPGELPRGESAVGTNGSPIVSLRVSGPPEKRISWERKPLVIEPETAESP